MKGSCFMKIWLPLVTYPCSCSSPYLQQSFSCLLFIRVLSFSLFSLPFFHFLTHPVREQNQGNHLSFGAEPKHHFLISNRYSSSPLSVLNSSSTIVISPTQSHFSHFPIYLISPLPYIFSIPFLSPLSILISLSP